MMTTEGSGSCGLNTSCSLRARIPLMLNGDVSLQRKLRRLAIYTKGIANQVYDILGDCYL